MKKIIFLALLALSIDMACQNGREEPPAGYISAPARSVTWSKAGSRITESEAALYTSDFTEEHAGTRSVLYSKEVLSILKDDHVKGLRIFPATNKDGLLKGRGTFVIAATDSTGNVIPELIIERGSYCPPICGE